MDACADHAYFLSWMLGEVLYGSRPDLRKPPPFEIHAVTDCKSLYDCVVRIGSNLQDKRTQIEVSSIREMIDRDGFHWVPTEEMHADPLTKLDPILEGRMRQWLRAPYCQLREVS